MSEKRPSLAARLWREAPVLTIAFACALAFVVFFAGRLVMGAIYWADPAHRDVPLEAWMTPRFVAMSWQVPPELVGETLGLARDGGGRRVTLGQLADDRGVPVSALIADLETAIAAHRETHP